MTINLRSRLVVTTILVFGAWVPLAAQAHPANLVTIDASAKAPPPETGYLHLGATSSTGHSLQVNSRYLVLDGKPWLPVMGELHFTRVPETEWEGEILKMKAAGVSIISTYIFWIHHEEVEGHFDWTGRRDLRRFVELCEKHGMYVWLRPGPWDHGEVRNGGFPDWLQRLPNTRTNDPVYLQHVTSFFQQIGQQLHGLMFRDGGPVIGTQLENEYGRHGPGQGAEHILKLKQIALAAGIDTPLFSVTGWPSLDFPPKEVIPVSGGYPDGFWYGSQINLPPSMNYLFNFNRELGDMGATAPSEDPTGKVDLKHDPYFAAEEAGGMASAYHRRPIVGADDIAALTLTGIGSGINLYGYYMFRGGTNPLGALTTLQESQATGFPNDLPERTYDFNAPIGEFGQERESYRKTRLMHLFLNAYGAELAPMTAFAPARYTRDAANTATARVAVRTDGVSGFIFVNNYVRQLPMPARPGFQVHIKLAHAELKVPTQPISLPENTYFAWPFHLAMGRATLIYSTSQLLTRVSTTHGDIVVFYAIPGVRPEFSFDPHCLRKISAPAARVRRSTDSIRISEMSAGLNSTIELTDDQGKVTTVLLLTKDEAEQTSLVHIGTQDHLVISASNVMFDGTRLTLRSTASPTQHVAFLPSVPASGGSAERNGMWMTYTFTQPLRNIKVDVQQTRTATARENVDMGPFVDWRRDAVPTVPSDKTFDGAAAWHLAWHATDVTGLSQLLLKVTYVGDTARLYSGDHLVDDNFYNGLPWEIGFTASAPSSASQTLDLRILPLPVSAPIYLDAVARKLLEATPDNPVLTKVEVVPEYQTVIDIGQVAGANR